jgi:hypothetical protein
MHRSSSVGIVTRLRTGRPKNGGSIPCLEENPKDVKNGSEAYIPSCYTSTGDSFARVKGPGCEADHLLLHPVPRVGMSGVMLPFSHTLSWRARGLYRLPGHKFVSWWSKKLCQGVRTVHQARHKSRSLYPILNELSRPHIHNLRTSVILSSYHTSYLLCRFSNQNSLSAPYLDRHYIINNRISQHKPSLILTFVPCVLLLYV